MILGAGGLGKTASDIFKANNIMVYGFLDEDTTLHQTEIQDITVLGSVEDDAFFRIIGDDCEACIAEEDMEKRAELAKLLRKKRKKMPMNVVHPKAILEPSVLLKHGNFIGAGVYVGSAVEIENNCLIYPNATLNHQVQIADFVHIGAGSIINSGVKIGQKAFIGSGVTITSGVKIGENARIVAGSVVLQDVPEGATVFGVPAQNV